MGRNLGLRQYCWAIQGWDLLQADTTLVPLTFFCKNSKATLLNLKTSQKNQPRANRFRLCPTECLGNKVENMKWCFETREDLYQEFRDIDSWLSSVPGFAR